MIERYGEPPGLFVPISAKDRQGGRNALGRLADAVDRLLAETGLDEDELVSDVTGPRPRRST